MKICLMGVGNVLMGDDALGPFVLKSLEAAWMLPANVTVLDAGTPGLDLTLFLDGFDALIAVDALQARGAPGEVRCFHRSDLLAAALPVVISPHEPTLREALLRLEVFGRCPAEVLLVGAIPGSVATGIGLSQAMRRALPAVEAQVLRELGRLGTPALPRTAVQPADLWWEAPPARKLHQESDMCLGVPGRILQIDGMLATVDFFGVRKQVRLEIVDTPVQIGDYVLNHVGFAIHRIPAEEIGETLALFDTILKNAEPQDLMAADIRDELAAATEPAPR